MMPICNPNPRAVRVAIVEDHSTFATELIRSLQRHDDIHVCGNYSSGSALLAALSSIHPDVVLVDLGLPDLPGVEVIRRLIDQGFDGHLLVITAYDDDEHLFTALETGACGYLVKGDATLAEARRAIIDIVQGGAPMSAGLARRVMRRLQQSTAPARRDIQSRLSEREFQLLTLLSKGYSAKEIAGLLQLSYQTVRTHQKNIYKKLQVRSAAEAAAIYHGA